MAKKSMIAKQKGLQNIVPGLITGARYAAGLMHLRKFGICRLCFRVLAYKGQIPGIKKPAGNKFWEEVENMQITDAIADMLTRIRNASSAKHERSTSRHPISRRT